MPTNPINLHEWSLTIGGAMQLLTKLHDDNVNLLPMMGKESIVYSEALYKALSNMDGMYDFLCGGYAYARKVKKNIARVKTYEYYRTLVTNSQ